MSTSYSGRSSGGGSWWKDLQHCKYLILLEIPLIFKIPHKFCENPWLLREVRQTELSSYMFCLTYKQMGEPADEDALLSCPMNISEEGRHDYQHVTEEEVKKETTLLGGKPGFISFIAWVPFFYQWKVNESFLEDKSRFARFLIFAGKEGVYISGMYLNQNFWDNSAYFKGNLSVLETVKKVVQKNCINNLWMILFQAGCHIVQQNNRNTQASFVQLLT